MTNYARSQRGLSLVELMIAMVLGLLISAAVIGVFIQNKRSFNQDELIAEMQENGRHALNVLVQDLASVDYWGGMVSSASITVTPAADLQLTTDCGPTSVARWAYDLSTNLAYLREATAAQAQGAHTCIAPTEFKANTDVLAIKRVAGSPATNVAAGKVYLRTNGTEGTLFQCVGSGTTCTNNPAPTVGDNYEYLVSVFYVRNHASAAGDGVPSLYRKRLTVVSGTPSITTEDGPVAEGVETFRVQFGIDSDGDQTADYFTASETVDAVSARIFVLVRSRSPAPGYTNDKTYQLGDLALGPFNDGFYRRVYSTTVQMRNPTHLRAL